MIEIQTFLELLPWLAILAGIVLIFLGFAMRLSSIAGDSKGKVESKGVILLGPIPIVWGYGRTGWAVAAIVAMILFALFLLTVG